MVPHVLLLFVILVLIQDSHGATGGALVRMPIFRPPINFLKNRFRNKQNFSVPIKSMNRNKKPGRLQMELQTLMTDKPEFIAIKSISRDMRDWQLVITGPKGSLYENENFLLRIRYPFEYPYKPPMMYFVKGSLPNSDSSFASIPKHQHIYSNGMYYT